MQIAAIPEDEDARLSALLEYEVLDSEDERAFDELTELASTVCGTEISLISLVDRERQWFKSRVGLDARETHRDLAFCAHAILNDAVFEVPNAKDDERFQDNPLVTGEPNIRFYAGAPLRSRSGQRIGTLCVIDSQPKQLDAQQRRALEILSNQVVSQLEVRLQKRRLERVHREREKFWAMLAHDIRSPFNGILGLSRILKESAEALSAEQIQVLANELLTTGLDTYQLIDEILQWSQNRMGQAECDLQPVLLHEAFDQGTSVLRETLTQKQIRLHNAIDPKHCVLADFTLLKSVIRNLLANAIKYSSAGQEIRIISRRADEYMILRIEDEGEGVPEAVQASLFQSHARIESRAGTAGELGHGLGLGLAYDFMKQQHGELWLDNSYQQGAAFELRLPVS